MPRVLHIIDSLDYHGAATQLLVVAKGLAQQGCDVRVCALNQHAPRRECFSAAGLATTIVPRRWSVDPLADWRLLRHVRRVEPDIVHTWDSVPGMFGAIAAGCRLVAGHYRLRRCQPGWEWAIERRLSPYAARFVTNSEVVREWCFEHGLPTEKFRVIPSSIDSAQVSDLRREELLGELNLPADARLIGVVGNLIPEKRVKDLIWAADLLRVLHDNLRMIIIGDGPLRLQLEEYARQASDLDHIRFLGAGNDVWRIMPHLDVLWNGSENVGQSAAILEAMSAGVPVVASDTPANRELVVHGETGYLIPFGTRAGRAARARATDRIFSDHNLAASFASAAQTRAAREFNLEHAIQSYLALYQ